MSPGFRVLTYALLATGFAGCHTPEAPAAKPEKIDMAVWMNPNAGAVMSNRPTLVAEGVPPLVYQAMQAGIVVQVVDAITAGTVGRARLMAGEIIRVDERGVFVGPDRVGDGPLAPDHRYRIVLEAQPDRLLGK